MLKIISEPIYPFVIKYLGLESEEYKLSYTTLGRNSLDLHDYVKLYLALNYNIKT